MTSKKWLILSIAVVLILAGFVLSTRKEEPKPAEPSPAPVVEKPRPCIPLTGEGKQTYGILTDKPQDLQIVEVEVDPIDVAMGETQKITVKVKDKNNDTITKESGVSAIVFTDNKSTAIASSAFKLALAGDEQSNGRSLITTWEGYWTRDDDYCRTYMETIMATNDKGDTTKVDLSFK